MLKIQKLLVLLLLTWATLFATPNAFADDNPIRLSVPYTMNLIIEYKHCKNTAMKQGKEIVILTNIIATEKERSSSLFRQNAMCTENYEIKKEQAKEWKAEYTKAVKELEEALKKPWWKFDLKSVTTGSIVTLILIML